MVISVLILITRSKKTLLIGGGIVAVLMILGVIVLISTPVGDNVIREIVGEEPDYTASVKSIETIDTEVIFDINGNNLHMSYTCDMEGRNVSVIFRDEAGNDLEWVANEDTEDMYRLVDERFNCCSFQPVYVEDIPAICSACSQSMRNSFRIT